MRTSRRVVLISVDGLMPNQRLPWGDHLRSLSERGSSCSNLKPSDPTLTTSCHATLATGAPPSLHGVLTNTGFLPEGVGEWPRGEPDEWHFGAHVSKVPWIWDAARSQGRKVALLRWPLSVGANVNWLVPEIFSIRERTPEADWKAISAGATPGLMEEIQFQWSQRRARPAKAIPRDHEEWDDWICEGVNRVLRTRSPDLVITHLNAFDHIAHEKGPGSDAAAAAHERTDQRIGRILDALDLKQDTVVILGDHGFRQFEQRIHLNALLQQEGWLDVRAGRILDWRIIAHTGCAMAFLHARQGTAVGPAIELLRAHAPGKYRLLLPDELRALGCASEAECAAFAEPGFSMGQNLEGLWITREPEARGEHGYLADDPEMATSLVAAGASVSRDENFESMSFLDVAPTIARWLGFEMGRKKLSA